MGGEKKEKKTEKETDEPRQKNKKNNVMWTVAWIAAARARDSRVIKLKFRCKWAIYDVVIISNRVTLCNSTALYF